MDTTQLTELVKAYITENGLSGKQDMGKVMGYLKSNFDRLYDGKLASGIVVSNL